MNVCETAMALLEARARDASVCPSEVARALAEGQTAFGWRSLMPTVHAAIDDLVAAGLVQLSWKGKLLDKRDGSYRIRRRQG